MNLPQRVNRINTLRQVAPPETEIAGQFRERKTSPGGELIAQYLAEEGLIEKYWPGIRESQLADLAEASTLTEAGAPTLHDELYSRVEAWRHRPLAGDFPFVFLGGLSLKRGRGQDAQKVPVLVAIGVEHSGYREILGIQEGATEDEASWAEFLGELKERGLKEVQLFVSGECLGLVESLAAIYPESFWQHSGSLFPQRVALYVHSRAH